MSIWDDKDVQANSEFVRFENVGDSVSGVITDLVKHTFVDDETGEKRIAPKLTIEDEDGNERILTAGQVRLRAALVELRPEEGDWVSIELTEVEKRGKKTLKHFSVDVKRAAELKPARAAKAAPAKSTPAKRAAAPAAEPADDDDIPF